MQHASHSLTHMLCLVTAHKIAQKQQNWEGQESCQSESIHQIPTLFTKARMVSNGQQQEREAHFKTGPVIWCSHWYTMGSEELPASLLSSFSRAPLNCWYLQSRKPYQIRLRHKYCEKECKMSRKPAEATQPSRTTEAPHTEAHARSLALHWLSCMPWSLSACLKACVQASHVRTGMDIV